MADLYIIRLKFYKDLNGNIRLSTILYEFIDV